MDSSTAEVYEAIRPGADFKRVCAGIAHVSRLKQDRRSRIILNFVMMTINVHQLPVCDQDPVHALFIARDGSVAPCINTAYGGASRILRTRLCCPA